MGGNMTTPDKLKPAYLIQEVKKALEREFDVDLEIGKRYLRDRKRADLFCENDMISILVVVNTTVSMSITGKINNLDKMLVSYDALDKSEVKKKIFVITDFQVYKEFKKALEEHTKGKSGIIADEDTTVELKLIEVPVFDNNFAKNSDNKKFTISQLMGAMSFGVLKYDKLPPEIKEVMLVMLKRLGYLRKKEKKIDNSAFDKK
tara:strand:- start:129 stop:740 length:612 start_codon:yes stop_codon:yes gene_type:complete